jgi:hypothetical protein
MKLFCGIAEGTPPGGAIILGRFDGMILAVGLGARAVDGSTMMLVPTMREVWESVAVAMREMIGEALRVTVGVTGMGMVAESLSVGVADAVDRAGGVEAADDVRASLKVELPELGGVKVALLGDPDEVADAESSDAGTLTDWLAVEVGAGDTDVPIEPVPEGRTPELADRVAEGVTLAVSEGVGTRSESDKPSEVGTPEEGSTPDDGKMPED